MLAFPFDQAGEIAGKTGTATNADGKTSDVWLLLFIPGPPEHPEKGIVLGFWMGKDSKDHPLGASRRDRRPRLRRVWGAQLGALGGDRARVSAEGARSCCGRDTSFSRSCVTQCLKASRQRSRSNRGPG